LKWIFFGTETTEELREQPRAEPLPMRRCGNLPGKHRVTVFLYTPIEPFRRFFETKKRTKSLNRCGYYCCEKTNARNLLAFLIKIIHIHEIPYAWREDICEIHEVSCVTEAWYASRAKQMLCFSDGPE
jgi:hypothetical protein